MGIGFDSMMQLTVHDINVLCEGHTEKLRNEQNRMLYQIHQQALLNSLAVWGSKSFPKEPRRVDGPSSNAVSYNRDSKNSEQDLHRMASVLCSLARPSRGSHN